MKHMVLHHNLCVYDLFNSTTVQLELTEGMN